MFHFLLLCRFETLDGNAVLQLDPAVPGVFNGPYPLGIDPVKTTQTADMSLILTTLTTKE